MDNQIAFQEAIYFNKETYFENIKTFVSKFDNSHLDQDYKKHLKQDTVIIPNGVPVMPEYVKTLSGVDGVFKFLVCGRITESKHIETILQAFRKLYEVNKNVCIDFYGSVEPYNISYYEKLCSDYSDLIKNEVVQFKGNIDYPRSIMKDYHSIIILGTHQGSPNMVLESASCKLPCITNDSGGTKEVINNETGILLPETPDAMLLHEAMYFTVYNYKTVSERAESAYQHIMDNFSMKLMLERYLNVIYS